jgi:hypothetical protein
MAWHGSNDFGEKAPTAPISKSPRPIAEVREYTHKALVVCVDASVPNGFTCLITCRMLRK